MQIDECKVTKIFFILDEYSKKFNEIVRKSSIDDNKLHRNKANRMSKC